MSGVLRIDGGGVDKEVWPGTTAVGRGKRCGLGAVEEWSLVEGGESVEILTTRFGPVAIPAEDRVEFPAGLVGVPQLKRFALVRDPQQPNLTWLQSARDPAWAMALVSARHVNPGYQVRVNEDHIQVIEPTGAGDVDFYVILNRTAQTVTANMQAPVLINRRRGLGVQLVLPDTRYELRQILRSQVALRKSA